MARRWRWPPDNAAGDCLALSPMPSRSRRSRPASLGRLALPAGDERGHEHVLQRRHSLEQVEELEDDADVLPAHDCQLALGLADECLASNRHFALVRHVEAGNDVEQRRLATARWSHHGDELAASDVEVGAAKRAHRGGVLLECAEHLIDVDDEVFSHVLVVKRWFADGHDAVS